MLHFEGDTDFPQPLATVWPKLNDIDFLIDCIPDLQAIKEKGPGKVVCVLRPGVSFIRGTLEVTFTIVEAVAQQSLRVLAHGKGIGSSNDVAMKLTFAQQDGGTRVHWTADVINLGGLLKALPKGLLEGAAKKVIADVWASVQRKMG